jgi:hypothetical protein
MEFIERSVRTRNQTRRTNGNYVKSLITIARKEIKRRATQKQVKVKKLQTATIQMKQKTTPRKPQNSRKTSQCGHPQALLTISTCVQPDLHPKHCIIKTRMPWPRASFPLLLEIGIRLLPKLILDHRFRNLARPPLHVSLLARLSRPPPPSRYWLLRKRRNLLI